MQIRKKIWPEFFEVVKSGEKKIELRLADFLLKAGDTLVLEEFDPKTKKFTGRKIEKKCKSVLKTNPARFYPLQDIRKYGFYIIELE